MKNEKDIKKNYLYNLIYTLLNTALPLLTAPYLARVIGANGVGVYAYYHSIAYFFYIFAVLGINNYGTRQISKAQGEGEDLSPIFSSIFYQQLITGLIANVSYWVYCFAFIDDVANRKYAMLMSFVVFSGIINIDWLFSGFESFKQISRKNIFVKTISVLLIFVVVKDVDDLWKYTLVMSLGTFFGYLSMWTNLKELVHFEKVPFKDVLSHLKHNFVLVIPVLSINVYRTMDKIMLGNMCDMRETGLFENAEKIIYALCGFITAFGTVMMPRISRMLASGQEKETRKYMIMSMQFMMSLMWAMSFGVFSVANDLVIVLFGEEFAESGILLAALAFTLPVIGWANIVRSQHIIPNGKDYIYVITVFSGAVVNLVVNLICIPKWGAIGAVIATLCAEGIIPVIQYFLLRKDLQYGLLLKKSMFAVIIGAVMAISVVVVGKALDLTRVYELIIQVLAGIIVYGVLTLLYIRFFEKNIYKEVKRLVIKR